jgi:hypothetical protein
MVSKAVLRTLSVKAIDILLNAGYVLDVNASLWSEKTYYRRKADFLTYLFDKKELSKETVERLSEQQEGCFCHWLGQYGGKKVLDVLMDKGVIFSDGMKVKVVDFALKGSNFSFLKNFYAAGLVDRDTACKIVRNLVKKDRSLSLSSIHLKKSCFKERHVRDCVASKAWGCLIYILDRNPWEKDGQTNRSISSTLGLLVSNLEDRMQGLLGTFKKILVAKEYDTEDCDYFEEKNWWKFKAYDPGMHKEQCDKSDDGVRLCKQHLNLRIEGLESMLKMCESVHEKYPSMIKQSKMERYFKQI